MMNSSAIVPRLRNPARSVLLTAALMFGTAQTSACTTHHRRLLRNHRSVLTALSAPLFQERAVSILRVRSPFLAPGVAAFLNFSGSSR
jgi:hypothetical protein